MSDYQLSQVEQAYAQAKKYGEELARLYAEEKERAKQLETTFQKLQAIFDTAPNAIAVVDNDLTILEANPRLLMMFEMSMAGVGQPLSTLLPTENLIETMRSAETEAAGLGRVEIEITEPVFRTILVTLSPLRDSQGWVLILHDLTERKRLENLKEEFVNIAAHELRTPLAGVIGFVGVLQEELRDIETPMANNLMELILQSTHRLKVIIDELVSFAAAQRNGTDDLHIANIDLIQLIRKTVKLLQETMDTKGITCHLDLPIGPITVQGDQFILSEVVYQLLKNAIVFNKEHGQIYVRVQRLAPGQADEKTQIEIEDTGIGIPQTDLTKIFDKFYQVEEHLTRGTGGLGLGLTIAQNGIERHRGELSVTSVLGKGSTFQLVLPQITELSDTSIDTRLDVAHKQTIIYAQDIARAIASQRRISKKIDKVKAYSADLASKLQDLSVASPGTTNYAHALDQVHNITQKLMELSDTEIN